MDTDLVTKISSLVAEVNDPESLLEWWDSVPNTPAIPTYWKRKGERAVLLSFGSRGSIIDLRQYTTILGREKTLILNGWISTPTFIALTIDPNGLPSQALYPFLIVATSSDFFDPERMDYDVKTLKRNPINHSVQATIGYADRMRKKVRFDVPQDLF